MGVLTKSERDGLEDVFLSIQSVGKYEKLKNLSILKNFLNRYGRSKATKISHFLCKYTKKKRNLSK